MKWIFFALSLFLISCQSVQQQNHDDSSKQESVEETQAAMPSQTVTVTPALAKEPLKLGLILGPGGSRAIAHIGVLKRLSEKKVPITAVVGLEWGAVVGSIYAQKSSFNEAEWQLSKIRDEKFRDNTDVREMLEPLQVYLKGARAEGGKLAFACPSLNVKKAQVYMLARGRLDQLLPYCATYPPVSQVFDWSVAGTREIVRAAEFLRGRGANRVILINVIPGLPLQDPINWHELAYDMRRKWVGVDQRLDIVIEQRSLRDYKMQTELIQSGYEQAGQLSDTLVQ